ncbi:DUF6297 family protein [Litorihabitans aurantiacus]|uniref:Uncharacterized protein n=1 Tax=Litorihabitans aurantiacus TaxID=1930061 RepID=A0AA37UQT6_9MICO|nr:DUF6297 family protein [Litorihabitans aurantiacus]GMA30848.1 hypothetical protein GCM10025875_08400 [Litorihabitans aurantiacus]
MTTRPELDAVPTGSQLRALTRAARRGHGGAPLSQLVGDAYTYLLTLVVTVALAISGAHVLGADFSGTEQGSAFDAGWLWLVAGLTVAGLALGVLARLGPIGVGGAGALWWLPTPADRLSLLRPTATAWIASTALGGAIAGGAISALTHAGPATIVWAVLAGAGLGAALAAAVAITQTTPASRSRARRLALAGDLLAMVAVALWIGVGLAGVAAPSAPALVVAVVALAAGVAAVVVLLRRLAQIPGAALRDRGARTGMATFAISTLDMRELGRVLTDPGRDQRRRTLSMGWVRGVVGAITTADALLLLRAPRQLVVLVASLGLPVAVTTAGASQVLAALAFVVGVYLAANAVTAGAREAEHAPALDRAFGISARAARAIRLIVPSLVCLMWSGAAVALLRGLELGWVVQLVLFAPAIAAAATKAAYRNPPDWSRPLVVSPMGAFPPGIVTSLATGPILAVVACLPVIIALFVGPRPVLAALQVLVTAILVAVATHARRRKVRAGASGAFAAPPRD